MCFELKISDLLYRLTRLYNIFKAIEIKINKMGLKLKNKLMSVLFTFYIKS